MGKIFAATGDQSQSQQCTKFRDGTLLSLSLVDISDSLAWLGLWKSSIQACHD